MALKKGDKGDQVEQLQADLKSLGFYTGAIDGTFGSETETAVKNFQISSKLKNDGIVGTVTNDAINEALQDIGC